MIISDEEEMGDERKFIPHFLCYIVFNCASIAAILASASACFLRSLATTCAGAPLTNRSLESFFMTLARKPRVYSRSSSSFFRSSSVSMLLLSGMKYSTVSAMKLRVPLGASLTKVMPERFPIFRITLA